jgi:DNA-binding transcriptional ArsR family regulator
MKVSHTKNTKKSSGQKTYPRPDWVPKTVMSEEELCPDCFKVVGERSRYNLVCMLGKKKNGMTVTEITDKMSLRQPTITHHLQVLQSVDAVNVEQNGREKIFTINRKAHCFEECKIPY